MAARTSCRRRSSCPAGMRASCSTMPISSARRTRSCSPLTLNAGRTCLAPRRVSRSAAVCAALERRADGAARCARDPFALAAPALPALVDGRVSKGARVVAKPNRRDGPGPLVLTEITPRMALFGVEVFAPVLLLCAAGSRRQSRGRTARRSRSVSRSSGRSTSARELVPQLAAGVAIINDAIVPAGHGDAADRGARRQRFRRDAWPRRPARDDAAESRHRDARATAAAS